MKRMLALATIVVGLFVGAMIGNAKAMCAAPIGGAACGGYPTPPTCYYGGQSWYGHWWKWNGQLGFYYTAGTFTCTYFPQLNTLEWQNGIDPHAVPPYVWF